MRTLGLGITLLPHCWASASSGIVFQRERRALDDFIAGTAVVYDWDARAARLRWIARKEGRATRPRGRSPGRCRSRGTELLHRRRTPSRRRERGGLGSPDRPSTMPRMSFTEVSRPHPQVAVVTLNRPERMNAMAFDVMIPFRDALREIGSDNEVRVVVITGAGRGFCSGADHENPGTMPNMEGLTLPTIALRSMEMLDDVISTIRRLHQPVVAAVNGAAIGGGFCLALAADVRIAADDAYFRAAGINNGLTAAELGLSFLLPRAIGHSRAAEIMLTGRDVDAAEADRIGLVSRVVPTGELLAGVLRAGGPDQRLEPRRRRADEAPAVEQPRRQQPAVPHGRGGHLPALRAHHDPQLRGGGGGSQGGPDAGLQGLSHVGRPGGVSGGIDEGVGGHLEVVTQLDRVGFRDAPGLSQLEQRAEHVAQPGVPLARADDERGVPHAEPGMPALLAVGAGTTPVLHQEQREVLGRLAQVVGVEGPQQGVAGDPEVETIHQVDEELLAADSIEQSVHGVESRGLRMPTDSRP